MTSPIFIQSRQNPHYKALKSLAQDPQAWKTQQRLWLEGEHLCSAWLAARHGSALATGLYAPRAWVWSANRYAQDHGAFSRGVIGQGVVGQNKTVAATQPEVPCWVLDDALFARLSPLPSPAGLGLIVDAAALLNCPVQSGVPTVILDGLQDPGNAGSILRSSKALGFQQILSTRGSVALFSPKVLRAAMGAHFGLHIVEGLPLEAQATWPTDLRLPLLLTLPHTGPALHQMDLPAPCAWIFGHEGQGASSVWQHFSPSAVRIIQPGGEESLNVAAAAAICLHASAARVPHPPFVPT